MVRNIFIVMLFLLLSVGAKATGQAGDIIYINGEKWILLDKPLSANKVVSDMLNEALPENRSISTANWDGYTATWRIKNDLLYLENVQYELYDEKTKSHRNIKIEGDSLNSYFSCYLTPDGILASWFTEKIRIGKGNVILYFHDEFFRYYETEYTMTLMNGKITQKQLYHNKKKEGFILDSLAGKIRKNITPEKYPEIQGEKIYFSLYSFQFTPDGKLTDCKINLHNLSKKLKDDKIIDDQNNPIIQAIKDMMKNIYPWEIYHINGEYKHRYYDYYNVPLNPVQN